LRHRPEGQGAAGRLNHRAADSLHESKQNQLENILREPAQQRADGHDTHAEAEHLVMAVDVSEAAANDAQPNPGHLIHDQRPRNAQHIRFQRCRQGRHGDHKHSGGNSSDGNADDRIDQGKPTHPLIQLSLILQIQSCQPRFVLMISRWRSQTRKPEQSKQLILRADQDKVEKPVELLSPTEITQSYRVVAGFYRIRRPKDCPAPRDDVITDENAADPENLLMAVRFKEESTKNCDDPHSAGRKDHLHRFGIREKSSYTLEETAKVFGITREKTGQIEAIAPKTVAGSPSLRPLLPRSR